MLTVNKYRPPQIIKFQWDIKHRNIRQPMIQGFVKYELRTEKSKFSITVCRLHFSIPNWWFLIWVVSRDALCCHTVPCSLTGGYHCIGRKYHFHLQMPCNLVDQYQWFWGMYLHSSATSVITTCLHNVTAQKTTFSP